MSKPDFTGKWTFNSAQSKLEIAPPTASSFEIAHAGPSFRLTRTLSYGEQSNTVTLDLVIDGEEHQHNVGGITAQIRMYWDGDVLVGDMRVKAAEGEVTNLVRYSIENGSRTLVARERFRSAQQNYDNIWVLDRQ